MRRPPEKKTNRFARRRAEEIGHGEFVAAVLDAARDVADVRSPNYRENVERLVDAIREYDFQEYGDPKEGR